MTQSVSSAVAKREVPGAHAMVQQYRQDFAQVLPSHIKPATWVRLAQGALKKGKKTDDGRTELEIAAANNPRVFLASLLDAARLGLEPGTEQYYLTPRKVKGQLEILGIIGYQGYIELMYRAGAISSVVAEVVHRNDKFRFLPGRDATPQHEIDWDSEDRGALRLVYAYARMKDGSTSKVVVLSKTDIARIKKSSPSSEWDSSPWQNHEAAMWLKSAVRQLAKWVPTSSEFIREQMRIAAEVTGEQAAPAVPAGAAPQPVTTERVTTASGDVLEGELLPDPHPFKGQPDNDLCATCGGYADDDQIHIGGA